MASHRFPTFNKHYLSREHIGRALIDDIHIHNAIKSIQFRQCRFINAKRFGLRVLECALIIGLEQTQNIKIKLLKSIVSPETSQIIVVHVCDNGNRLKCTCYTIIIHKLRSPLVVIENNRHLINANDGEARLSQVSVLWLCFVAVSALQCSCI